MLSRDLAKKFKMKIPFSEDCQLIIEKDAYPIFQEWSHQDLPSIEEYYKLESNEEKTTDRPVITADNLQAAQSLVPKTVHFYMINKAMLSKIQADEKPWKFFKAPNPNKNKANKTNSDNSEVTEEIEGEENANKY